MKYNVMLSSIFVDSIKPLKITDKKNISNKNKQFAYTAAKQPISSETEA